MTKMKLVTGPRVLWTLFILGMLYVFISVFRLDNSDKSQVQGRVSAPPAYAMGKVIPLPVLAEPAKGEFMLRNNSVIQISPATKELKTIGLYLQERLRPATGFKLDVQAAAGKRIGSGILITTTGGDPALGEEGYELTIKPDLVTLRAYRPMGLFRGIQTVRQLLPSEIERNSKQKAVWRLTCGSIRDYPRFAWRGVMLDVARHFFTAAEVKRFIDLAAYYKINRFHLHLTDDQGWRLMLKSWPKLATIGGRTEVGGGSGGYYTQEEYREIAAYAQSRYVTLIPEIDMPGHFNAALTAYPELNADGRAPEPYTGTDIGFSTLAVDKEITYKFVDDVMEEVAAMTPGPYIHLGGDDASKLSEAAYIKFMERAQAIVKSHGKTAIGWEEIGKANLLPTTVVQHFDIGDLVMFPNKGSDLPLQAVSRQSPAAAAIRRRPGQPRPA